VLETEEELLKHIDADQLHLFDEKSSYFTFVSLTGTENSDIVINEVAKAGDETEVTPYKAVEGTRIAQTPKEKLRFEEPEKYATIETTRDEL